MPERRRSAGFDPARDGFSIETLEEHEGTVYAVDRDFRLLYYNPGWIRFALENGAQPDFFDHWLIGRSVLEAVAEPLRTHVEALIGGVIDSGRARSEDYECSSAEVFRLLRETVYPLRASGGALLVHAIRVVRPHDADRRPHAEPDPSVYVDAEGLIHMCSHCRRVRSLAVEDGRRWDWVSEWVARVPAQVSHGLCPVCIDFYYPPPGEEPEPPI